MPLRKLLRRQRRPEIRIVRPDQRQSLRPHDSWIGSIARFAALLRDQARRTNLMVAPQKPKHVPAGEAQQLGCLRDRNPLQQNVAQYLNPIELASAHRHHRHHAKLPGTQHSEPVTSLTGRLVTFLTGAYRFDSHKVSYGTQMDASAASARKCRHRSTTDRGAKVWPFCQAIGASDCCASIRVSRLAKAFGWSSPKLAVIFGRSEACSS